ncbi:PAS domain S-box protein, partial [Escherichia coli]|uniref:PAS domain S-box protein n=1 Tax=Escherichia coli TaxID=562 RepID=UPI0021C06343
MGSCAAPSAKGDDKFITTDYLQQCHILSTTSPQSHITYVNPDFIKISGFTEEELLGQPHNI